MTELEPQQPHWNIIRTLPKAERNAGQIKSLRLYLIRHGATEWSLSGQYTGSTDIALTAQGEAEAREVGQRLRGISFAHILTSPLQRSRQTVRWQH